MTYCANCWTRPQSAILACPNDSDRKTKLERRLADAHISAIWYPEGEYEYIDQILELLAI
jgi:hypothetical protein